MKRIFILPLIIIALTCTSCFSKYDDPNPSAITAEITTIDQTEDLLTAVYNSLYNTSLLNQGYMALLADDGFPGYDHVTPSRTSTYGQFHFRNYTSSNSVFSNMWTALYTGIFRANQTLEALDQIAALGVSSTSEDYIMQKGEALFFRGLFHFYLHSVFNEGNVIYYDFVPKEGSDFLQPLLLADTVQAKFRADLEQAHELLEELSGTNYGRVTKGTAATILGTSYLYSREYEKAMTYFEEVINSGAYEIVDDIDLICTQAGEVNDESIFEVCYQLGVHPELTSSNRTSYGTAKTMWAAASGITLPAWLAVAYQTEQINRYDSRNVTYDNNGIFADSLTLLDTMQLEFPRSEVYPFSFPRYRTVSRRGCTLVALATDDDRDYYGSEMTSMKVAYSTYGAIGYYRKYTNWDICEDENNLSDGQNHSGRNFVVNRLTGVYLMYAECLIYQNRISEAIEYINTIRNRWGLRLIGMPDQQATEFTNPSTGRPMFEYDSVQYDQISLLEHLQNVETALELSAEGFATRFINLRRWGIAQDRYTYLASKQFYIYNRLDRDCAEEDIVLQSDGSWVEANQKDVSQWGKVCYDNDLVPMDDVSSYTLLTDYKESYSTYEPMRHSYLPIPLLEQQNNPNLENIVKIKYY